MKSENDFILEENMTTLHHLTFIINEHSRNGHGVIPRLTKALRNYSISYDVHKTNKSGHAKELAQILGKDIQKGELLVAVGGDGTLNEVVSGLEEQKMDTAIAYIPTGSGNDFARSHGFPLKLEKALARLFDIEEATELDLIVFKDNNLPNVAINSVGVGIDGMVISKVTTANSKEKMGKLSYLASVISAYFSQKPFPISIKLEERVIEFSESLLSVAANHKFFGGGIPIYPKADPQDSTLNLVVAEKVNFLELIHILARVLINSSHLKHKKLHTFNTKKCEIHVHSEEFGQKDGELLDKKKHILILETNKRKFWI